MRHTRFPLARGRRRVSRRLLSRPRLALHHRLRNNRDILVGLAVFARAEDVFVASPGGRTGVIRSRGFGLCGLVAVGEGSEAVGGEMVALGLFAAGAEEDAETDFAGAAAEERLDDGEVGDDDCDKGFAAGPFASCDGAVGAGLCLLDRCWMGVVVDLQWQW